jgi:hypothetical protein
VRLSGEAATECTVSWLANDRQQLRSLVVGWGLIPCFEKGGWRCMRFGHVRKWLSNSVVKRREVGFLGKEAREVRLTFQCTRLGLVQHLGVLLLKGKAQRRPEN